MCSGDSFLYDSGRGGGLLNMQWIIQMKETRGRNYIAYTPVCICSKCGSEYDFIVSKILTECPKCHEDFDTGIDQQSKNE